MILILYSRGMVMRLLSKIFKLFPIIFLFVIFTPRFISRNVAAPIEIENNRPNILFITVDDMNFWTGYLKNHPEVLTPNIDKLAENGMYFTNAHAPATLCRPSRSSYMTGWKPTHLGILSNEDPLLRTLWPGAITIPEYFQQNGYYTMGVGKMNHEDEYNNLSNEADNNPATALDDRFVINKNEMLFLQLPGVLANDYDADGDRLVLDRSTLERPQNGRLLINRDGGFAFIPRLNFTGVTTFSYQIRDRYGSSNFATVSIEVLGGESSPPKEGWPLLAFNDAFEGFSGELLAQVDINVLKNDFAPNQSSFQVALETVISPEKGTLEIYPNGFFKYLPEEGFIGIDTFSYRITDGVNFSERATVAIKIADPIFTEPWDLYQPTDHFFGSGDLENYPMNGYTDITGFNTLLDWGGIDLPESEFPDGAAANWAINKLQEEYSTPFFLGVGFSQPHTPWYLPLPYYNAFFDDPQNPSVTLPPIPEGDEGDLPETGRILFNMSEYELVRAHDALDEAVAAYLASVYYVDAQIGKVLSALEASPYADNTIIVLTSDHGRQLGDKEMLRKRMLWTNSTLVPLLIKAPGVTNPASRSSEAVSLLDLFPTLVELAGLPHREDLEGLSFVPLLRNSEIDWFGRSAVTYTNQFNLNASLQQDQWKYILYGDGGEELYNTFADPYNLENLAADATYIPVINEMKRILAGQMLPNEAPIPINQMIPTNSIDDLYLIDLSANDINQDYLSFSISQLPQFGTLYSTEDGITPGDPITHTDIPLENLTENSARVFYQKAPDQFNDNFTFIVSDGRFVREQASIDFVDSNPDREDIPFQNQVSETTPEVVVDIQKSARKEKPAIRNRVPRLNND